MAPLTLALSLDYREGAQKPTMSTTATNFVMPAEVHNALVAAAYRHRGYAADAAARFSELTARHGIKTHNAIKHLDEHFGSNAGGC